MRDNWGFGPSDRGATGGDEAYRPYRRLAVGVLARALQDLSNPAGTATDRESARVFFTGSGMLSYWCLVASLDPQWVAGRVLKLGQVTSRETMPYTIARDKPLTPAACPVCRSTDLKTTSKTVDEATYWRCATCGEVWNAGRRRDATSWGSRR